MKPKTEDTFQSHNSASLVEAERRIKALEEENLDLKRDYANISSLYNVLVKDGQDEKFDERRVNLLKSQLIQLERQVLMLTDSLGSRAGMLLEVENGLHTIAEISRNQMSEGKGAVTVSRENLKKILDAAESCRIKLSKNIESSSPESYSRPLLMMDKFIKQSSGRTVSLFDVCSGSTEHINLKHVAKLESRLAEVFHQLTSINHSLGMSDGDVSHFGKIRLTCQLTRTCELIKQTTAELLELSLLIPSAPWPPIQKNILKDIKVEDVLKNLPNFPKSRALEGQQKIEALIKAYNYILTMKNMELKSTNRELQYQTAVHNCQQDCIQSILESMKTAYADFENSTNDVLCKPLKEILNKYHDLEQRSSESDLRDFLTSFKRHAPEILSAVDQLQRNREERTGIDALSSFGAQFFESIDKLHSECTRTREEAIAELEQVKQEATEFEYELKQLFPSVIHDVNAGQQTKGEYQQIVAGTEDPSLNTTLDQNSATAGQVAAEQTNVGDMSMPVSARSRRRAAKLAVAAESPSLVRYLPAPTKSESLTNATTDPFTDESAMDMSEDAACSCGAEFDKTWEDSLRRYTPDLSVHQDDQQLNLARSKPPLGPIKASKYLSGTESPTSQSKKLLPSRLPKAQAKLSHTVPSGGTFSERPRTPQSRIPKSGTPQSKLTLKSRNNRSHSLDNSGQGLTLLNQSADSGASPSMKRSTSLLQRPDWVT